MPGIIVWSKPVCQQCKATYRTLDNAGLEYEVRNIEEFPEQLATFKSRGLMAAPIVEADGEEWAGFNPIKLGELIAKAKLAAAERELVAA